MIFRNRIEAGQKLAEALSNYKQHPDVLVAGLPRGGVPIAGVVADALGAPLDVVLVRKLGMPFEPELAFGAIAEGGIRFVNEQIVEEVHLAPKVVEDIVWREQQEIERRSSMYRGSKAAERVEGKTVIVIDDGLATGATMFAAVRALRRRGAAKVVVAVPVSPHDTLAKLRKEADDVVCLYVPDFFMAVGAWYDDFAQVSDAEVQTELAARANKRAPASSAPA